MPVFTTPAPITVRLDLPVGDAKIIASDRTDTVVEVHPGNPAKKHDVEAAERTTVDFSGNRLVIRAPSPKSSLFGRTSSVRVTVELPAGSTVQADAQWTTFSTEGTLGACRFTTGGEVRLDRTGTLWLNSSIGDVLVEHVDGDVDVTAGSGEVRIQEATGGGVIRNSSGSCWIGRAGGDVRLNTASGHITVDRAEAGVEARTAFGEIRIGEVSRGRVQLETSAGEIEVGIRAGVAAWLEVSTGFGQVSSELDDAAEPPGDPAETVEVRARSGFGNIRITRAR
ncbi:DUF4097 family beta strand repeat-containing protein [Amycolatopsis albispora]|uniref:DUF4097 domain-containing protein n=1 Tax=Amycolatopsis albispora TaxID=1804986 RepID=A0A344LHE4_9PSEU|nr:DUF4097 family beta strand repeat-containing protein [Amycolatopsis albispora]AXB47468.1 hypothetical protein A4R43_37590 [Amycolatopsis albispora]